MPYRPSKPFRISVGKVYAKTRSDLVDPITRPTAEEMRASARPGHRPGNRPVSPDGVIRRSGQARHPEQRQSRPSESPLPVLLLSARSHLASVDSTSPRRPEMSPSGSPRSRHTLAYETIRDFRPTGHRHLFPGPVTNSAATSCLNRSHTPSRLSDSIHQASPIPRIPARRGRARTYDEVDRFSGICEHRLAARDPVVHVVQTTLNDYPWSSWHI